MTPRQLKYFVEIARSGSTTTAAGTLHIAQPALSHHIATMEEELGVPLLERHPRGVKLTPEGQRLFERATAILRQMDALKDEVRGASAEARGPVSLCIAGAVAHVLGVPLYRWLAAHAPQVRLQLSTAMSREAQALLEARRVELALMPNAFELPRLEAVPLFEERFCLFGAAALCAGEHGPIRLADIGDRPLVAPDREHDLRKLVERSALDQGCTLNVRYELNDASLSRQLVREGLAFAIMPRNAFGEADASQVVAREITRPTLARVQSLAWLADHALTPAGEAVRSGLQALVRELAGQGLLHGRLLP